MAQPLKQSDIIFPHLSNTPNFSSTLSSLKRSALSITNRLNSITEDSEFVSNVATSYDLPLVANERCGSWYIPLDLKAASVYFKSTDGHMGEWAFSLRRLNLQLLDVVSQYGGCVIVDSTRRGKSMPDALSKTVPFWCCVINRAVFGSETKGDGAMSLFTPPNAVSASEHTQMEKRVDGFVQQFLDVCKPNIPLLRSKIQKPLRPMWVTQASILPSPTPVFTEFHPIILCTASRRVHGAEASEGGYIQGAADDHEAWSHSLTPPLFWSHKEELLHTNEEDLPSKIADIISQDRETDAISTLIQPTSSLYVSASQNIDFSSFDTVISCTPEPLSQSALKNAGVTNYLHLPCQHGKLGSRDLRTQLPALHLLASASALHTKSSQKTLICCPTGKDLSVGTALAFLCLYANEEGTINLQKAGEPRAIDKTLIKQRLSWITTSAPALNPSRTTLQSVNSVLMSPSTPKAPLPQLKTPASHDPHWNPLSSTSNSLPPTLFATLSKPTWHFTRTLSSLLPTHPSGTVTGSATFTPLSPHTLLYAENGAFTTATGLEFSVRKKYVYQLTSPGRTPSIVVKFFDDAGDGGGEGEGGVFVEMGELREDAEAVWVAENKAQHVCGEDLYRARWRFGSGMVGENGGGMWWEVRYDVKGPRKEYVSTTRYERVDKSDEKDRVSHGLAGSCEY